MYKRQLRNYVAIRERIAGARQALRKIIKEANSKEVDEILDNLSFQQRLLKIYSNLKRNLGDISVYEVLEILKNEQRRWMMTLGVLRRLNSQLWTLIIF